MTSQYWKLPVNWKDLIESVQWASGGLSLYIEAPLTVTMELTEKKDKSALMLHLLNFDFKNSPVQDIKVDVQIPEGKKVKQVAVLTPDGRSDDVLTFRDTRNRADFTVPQLNVYNMVVIKLE